MFAVAVFARQGFNFRVDLLFIAPCILPLGDRQRVCDLEGVLEAAAGAVFAVGAVDGDDAGGRGARGAWVADGLGRHEI
jgi:hypothetical protein